MAKYQLICIDREQIDNAWIAVRIGAEARVWCIGVVVYNHSTTS